MELIGLYLAACGLLVVAGAAKAVRPMDTARALSSIVPVSLAKMRVLVRLGAMAESMLGVVALLMPGPVTGALVGLSYLAFAGVVGFARRKGGSIASCGCFGTPDTPATLVHLVINVALAASAIAIAIAAPVGSLVSVLAGQPGNGIPLVLVSALCGWLAFLAITVLAEVKAARGLTAVSFRGRA
jgi:hypothetical protein